MMKHTWKKRSGEGYIDTCVLILCAMLVIALAVKVLPVYVAKQQLDTFAAELVREAEITAGSGVKRPHARRCCLSGWRSTRTSAGPAPAASSSMRR